MAEPLKFDFVSPAPEGVDADAVGYRKTADGSFEVYWLKAGPNGEQLHRRIASPARTSPQPSVAAS